MGCGSGRHTVYFAKNGFDTYGIDIAPVGLKMAKDWFKKIYILSDSCDSSEVHGYEMGYVTKEIIKKYVKNIDDSVFYICGPEIMKTVPKKY